MRTLLPLLATGTVLLTMACDTSAQAPIIIPCNNDPVPDIYCYVDNDYHVWHWQSECGEPLVLQFNSGTLGPDMGDRLAIHDGPDTLGTPMVVLGGPETTELAGMVFVSTGAHLVMKMISNDTISCVSVDGFRDAWDWEWTVAANSGTAGIEGMLGERFTMYPNPVTRGSHLRLADLGYTAVVIRIMDIGGRTVYTNTAASTTGTFMDIDLSGLQSGQYSVVLSTPAWVRSNKLQIMH